MLLFGISVYILFEAWERLRRPPEVDALPMLLVAVGGLAVTLIGVKLLQAGSEASLNVKGAFLEVLSDMLGAVGTLLAALVLLVTGWPYADIIASVFIGVFILPRAFGLLKGVVSMAKVNDTADAHRPRAHRYDSQRCARRWRNSSKHAETRSKVQENGRTSHCSRYRAA
jgi:cation diffusion facilitator family transporter